MPYVYMVFHSGASCSFSFAEIKIERGFYHFILPFSHDFGPRRFSYKISTIRRLEIVYS